MVVFGVPLLQTIGTCMMVILPISAAGGSAISGGRLDWIFIQTLAGLAIGAWFGAKWTHLAPLRLLRVFIVGMPPSAASSRSCAIDSFILQKKGHPHALACGWP